MQDAVTAGAASRAGRKIAWLWGGALAVLGACVVMMLWFPLLHVRSVVSFDYNEGWNAYRQAMTVRRQPLYGRPPGLWMTNYPFLSFHVVGMLGAAIGSVVAAGRIIAFASMILVGVFAGGVVREAGGSAPASVFAGLCLVLWIATFVPELRAVDDPEMLGAAIAGFGLLAYVKGAESLPWIGVSAAAFAIGLFVKQDFIALPLGVGIDLVAGRRWKALAAWLAAGLIAAGLLTGLTFRLDGAWFFANLLRPRAYLPRNLAYNVVDYALHFAAPLVLCVVLLVRQRGLPHRRLLFLLLLFGHAVAIGFSGGDGVAQNIFCPPVVVLAIACGMALGPLDPRRSLGMALAVPVLAGAVFVPFQFRQDLAAQRRLPVEARAARRAVALLGAAKGPAICETILLCYEAGKRLGFDPYFVNDQLLIGRLKPREVLALLAAHRYAAIEIDGGVDGAAARLRFTGAFMRTLLAHYRPVLDDGIYTVFEPRRGP